MPLSTLCLYLKSLQDDILKTIPLRDFIKNNTYVQYID